MANFPTTSDPIDAMGNKSFGDAIHLSECRLTLLADISWCLQVATTALVKGVNKA